MFNRQTSYSRILADRVNRFGQDRTNRPVQATGLTLISDFFDREDGGVKHRDLNASETHLLNLWQNLQVSLFETCRPGKCADPNLHWPPSIQAHRSTSF